MNSWLIVAIIALVLGVVISNILLLKYSAKFNLPAGYKAPEKSSNDDEKSTESETPESQQQAHNTVNKRNDH